MTSQKHRRWKNTPGSIYTLAELELQFHDTNRTLDYIHSIENQELSLLLRCVSRTRVDTHCSAEYLCRETKLGLAIAMPSFDSQNYYHLLRYAH